MEPLTIYRAKGKKTDLVFLFKYDLNGHLRGFQIDEGELTPEQMDWLFTRFPANEYKMENIWMKLDKYKNHFTVEKSNADLSFESFWEIYGLKHKKELAIKAWNKLTEAEKIKCFLNIKNYKNWLAKTGQAQAHLVTWLNQKRFNDEY